MWVPDSVDCTTPERVEHLRFETSWLVPELSCSLLVEWVIGVRLNEEENKAENDRVDAQNRLPVGTKNVQAHIAFCVNVRMVDRRVTVDLGSLVGVGEWDLHAERVRATLPHAVFFG